MDFPEHLVNQEIMELLVHQVVQDLRANKDHVVKLVLRDNRALEAMMER